MTSLHLRDVSVAYRERVALHPLTVTVESGTNLGVIGPNGAGKSSLLRAITGLVGSTGELLLDAEPLPGVRSRQRARLVAYVPQAPILPDDMSGFDYVMLGRNPYVGYFSVPSADDRDIAREVIRRLALDALADRPLGELSGGEQQRLVLARAMAQRAPILLLDEPTSALDIGHRQQVLDLVAELQRDDGLVVVSAMHDLTLAGLYADELMLLDHGTVVAKGSAAHVLTPDVLSEHYGARVRVVHDDDGTVVVIPRR